MLTPDPDPGDLRALVDRLPPPSIPLATYRLQLHAGFRFEDARRLVPYLHDLGISHAYTSPYLRARSGSTHGYDVADPNALNPELGSLEEYERLTTELVRRGMGQLVDVVPNHMGIGDPGNFRWWDVLENGPSSRYAPFFDINWTPLKAEIQDQNRLVLPTLGDQYGRVLENGELWLRYADGAFSVGYYDQGFPVAPDSYWRVLQPCLERLELELGREDEHTQELASIVTALRHLPPRDSATPDQVEERSREKEIGKRRIRQLHEESEAFRAALDEVLREIGGRAGVGASFDALDALIGEQSYRLAFWRVAAEEINYRRFFDITELAAVRMEDHDVFLETHQLLLRLVREGRIAGLRIDHPDGLRDPAGYLWQLQRSCFVALARGQLERSGLDAPDDLDARLGELFDQDHQAKGAGEGKGNGRCPREMYVVVEKILALGEELPADWPVHGTTGYDFLNVVNDLFVARANERSFGTIYERFQRGAGPTPRFRDLSNSARKLVMLISLGSEVNELGYLLKRIAGSDRRHRDFTLNSLSFAIREVIAGLDVYRTYIDPATGRADDADRERVWRAVAEAKRRNPRTDPSIFDFVGATLLFRDADEQPSPEDGARRIQFIARFQQTSGPVMAKGVEDTAFYIYNRLVSLNEVGGQPDRFGTSLTAFHRFNVERTRQWLASLSATSTHDTKRSEDVRARINVLSELPGGWRSALTRWSRLNGRKKVMLEGRAVPDRNEEYLLYQTLLGVWPFGSELPGPELTDRVVAFMLKALKEAKVNTSWINANTAYETAVEQFVRAILDADQPNPFLDDFYPWRERVAHFGILNALAQTLLKLTAPGVPDIYQGNELWDLSLVDPDNRRPVDYDARRCLLAELRSTIARGDLGALVQELLEQREDGRIKLYVTHRLLAFRQQHPEIFAHGSYVPLRSVGAKRLKAHVCAFARATDGQQLIVVAPVLTATLTKGVSVLPLGEELWRDTALMVAGEPGQRYRNLFTGELLVSQPRRGRPCLPLAEVCQTFPVGALVDEP